MNGSQKDDADHLAAYAEKLLGHAKEAMEQSEIARREASNLVMRARIAIREASALIPPSPPEAGEFAKIDGGWVQ